MQQGRTRRARRGGAAPARSITIRGLSVAATALVSLGVSTLAFADDAPDPAPAESTTESTIESTAAPTTAAVETTLGSVATPSAAAPAEGTGKGVSDSGLLGVVGWIDGAPRSRVITATILDGSSATFADGSTSAEVVTDPTGEPVVLELRHVPAGGARVRLQTPVRSDATFWGVTCEASSADYPSDAIDHGAELTVVPQASSSGAPSWGDGRPYPVCWFDHADATRLTIGSRLDDAAPAAGAEVAVIPETGRVGVAGTFEDDGLLTIGDAPLVAELTGFEWQQVSRVFVGQVAVSGSTIYGVTCVVDGVKVTGPIEARELDDRTVVGITIEVTLHHDASCTVEAANADLRAAKTASTAEPRPGDVFEYAIVATNAGRAPLFAAAMSDPVPSQLTVLGVTTDEPTTTCAVTGNQVDCTYGDLPAGAVRTVHVQVVVHADVTNAAAITNVALVRGDVPLWIPGLGAAAGLADGAASVAPALDRPPVFATAVLVLASSVVRAFAPTATGPQPTTTAVAPSVMPTSTAPAAAASTAPTVAPAAGATAPPSTALAAQLGPVPTVTGGSTLPSTGNDLSLLAPAGWTTVAGLMLVVVRRTRRTARR